MKLSQQKIKGAATCLDVLSKRTYVVRYVNENKSSFYYYLYSWSLFCLLGKRLMKKLLFILLLTPLTHAESKEIIKNLSCKAESMTICVDKECSIFNREQALRNGLDMTSKSLSVKKYNDFYFLDYGFGFELAEKQANSINLRHEGKLLFKGNEDWSDKYIDRTIDLLTREHIYEVSLAVEPFSKVLSSTYSCIEGTSLFD